MRISTPHKSVLYMNMIVVFILAAAAVLCGQNGPDRIYVGEVICRKCHHLQGNRNQFNPWRTSKHARAYTSLFKPEAKQIAELSGIDIKPHESPVCLGCHTTAYKVESWEKDPTFHVENGIQCEKCHGPGSEYIDPKIMKDSVLSKQAGLMFYKERDCLVCHKEKNSHVTVLNSRPFDYKKAIQEIKHSGTGGPHKEEVVVPKEEVNGPRYVGVFQCVTCHDTKDHERVFSEWHQSAHARAYVSLAGKEAQEIASAMGVSGLPQESDICLECHTTGKGYEAGRFADNFDFAQGVQCESCHGPASEHIAVFAETDYSPGIPSRLNKINRESCTGCHREGIHGKTFDFESGLALTDHSQWQETGNGVQYKTPFNLALNRSGDRLFVACEASNSLIILNTQNGEIIKEIRVGAQPHFVCLSPDESTAYVSNRANDNVSVIDLGSMEIISVISVGDEPHEMAVTRDGKTMYVANAGTYDVSVIDLTEQREIKRIAASRGPWGAALSPDGKTVYISNNLPRYGKFRASSESEVTMIDAQKSVVKSRLTIDNANLVQGIAVSPDNSFAIVTLNRTKNLIPMTRNMQGWIITNGIGILWPDGRTDQLLLDEPGDFFADPTDVVFSNDGRYIFISGGGVQEIAMIDVKEMKNILLKASDYERNMLYPNHLGMSFRYLIKRIPVGRSPRGMAISADNKLLYVADGLDDAVSVIDIDQRKRIKIFDLGGPQEITQARYGERIFHDAQYTFSRQFSCHSCHPDGGVDGLTYDIEPDGLGFNPVDNRTLRGINDTAPFKWTGKNPTLKRQCGPRLAAFFTRTDPFLPEQSAALERYIVTIPRPPNRYRTGDTLTDAQRRGKKIFERLTDNSDNVIPPEKRCSYCHSYPYFTSREIFDVGTASWLDTQGVFDVPHLNNIYATSPYLHDGRARSLEEIWTLYNPKDTHGLTNDLTKDQLNDLIEYLKTL